MPHLSFLSVNDNSSRIIRGTFNASSVAYIVSGLTSSVGSLIDGVVIGQFLGVDSMAAFGLVSPVVIVFALIGAVIAAGARSRFTMLVGKSDLEGAKGIFSLSVLTGTGSSVLLMAAVAVFATPLCVLLGASGQAAGLLVPTRDYLLGLVIGLPAVNTSRVLTAYMTIDNDSRLPVVSSVVLTVTDIILDLIVAVTGGGTFEMGLATSISQYAALAVLLFHFRRKERLTRFSWKAIRWKEAGRMFSKGLPTGVGRIANIVRTVLLNRILATVSFATAGAIAAYSVHRQTDSLLNPFIFGVADTVVTLTGLLISEENRPMLRRLTKHYFALVSSGVAAVAVLFWFAAPYFAAFFIRDDAETLQYGIRAVRSFTAALPLYALNRAYIGFMEGKGEIRKVMCLNFLSEGGYIVLSAVLLFPFFHVDAIWYALPASQVLMLLTITALIGLKNLREKKQPADFWEWLMVLPADFDVPEADRIDRTISSHDEVIALSRAAWEFCDAHGCDEKRKYILSLAVEELATNTVLTGFRPNRHNTIDMRILKKGSAYILRIRDDCEIFDPVKQLQLYDRNIPMHHMGLQMAIESASDVQYTTMLRLNNLVLRV